MSEPITDKRVLAHKWYGRVSQDWPLTRLSYFCIRNNTKNRDLKEQNLLSLSFGEVIRKNIEQQEGLLPESFDGYQIVESGNIIVRLLDLQNDHKSLRSALVKERGIITSAYVGLIVDNTIAEPRFVNYSLRAMDQSKYLYSLGAGVRQTLKADEFLELSIPLPGLATQRRIADRLDRETGEIDSLVKELDEYVGLLERRKKAAIRHSLEEISAELPSKTRLHMFCSFVSGVGFPLDEQGIEDEEYPFLKVSSLTRTLEGRSTISDRSNCVSKETAERLGAPVISPGSILLAKIGEAARLMRIRAVDSNCCIDNNLLAIIPDESFADSDFLRHALSGLRPTLLLTPGTIPTINMSVLRNFSIPLPDLETQRRIADRLDRETTETDALVKECTTLKELLLKRRQVLITDMVTGKVEV